MGAQRKIGLLGGSFNPAHDGHLHISLLALQQLGLDRVWWLVSPQNPLKPRDGMAGLAGRLRLARRQARHPHILVTDLERTLGTRYTIDTLRLLVQGHRDCTFVWLMGADNLIQLPQWRNWDAIMALTPLAVFDRPGFTYRALAGRAAQRYRGRRVNDPRLLAKAATPAWSFVFKRRHPASATAIRAQTDA
jgi:nicotinate-nucleotide adenylyltransferase